MAKKDCTGEFATEKQKIKNMEKVVFGNGDDGIVKRVRTIEEAITIIESYNHIKTWILGVAVGFLSLLVGSMATYIWTTFGG